MSETHPLQNALLHAPIPEWQNTPYFKKYVLTGEGQISKASDIITSPEFRRFWGGGSGNTTGVRVASEAMDNIVPMLSEGFDLTSPYRPRYANSDLQLTGMDASGEPTYRPRPDARNINRTPWDLRNQQGAQPLDRRQLLALLKYRYKEPTIDLTRYVQGNAGDRLAVAEELTANMTGDAKVWGKPARIVLRSGDFAPQVSESNAIMAENAAATAERNALLNAETGPTRRGTLYHTEGETNSAKPFYADTNPSEERSVGRIRGTWQRGQPSHLTEHTLDLYGPASWKDIAKARGAQLANIGGKLLVGAGVALTPFDAVNRRNLNFNEFYQIHGREPTEGEAYKLAVLSGLEPALNAATFGLYDGIADTAMKREMDMDFYRARGRRNLIQEGIDYPMFGGRVFERTTK
jgi:hypothetical protein